MVWSWPHYLRHQWSQISTFAYLNHIHHHTYFKSPYVHIQAFHILHHYTMKLLQAFKSFLPGGLLQKIGNKTDSSQDTQFSSENWFTVGRTVWQRKPVRCRPHISTAKTSSLSAAQFSSENCFAVVITISKANATSLQPTRLWQRMLIRCRQLDFGNKSHFCYKQHNFDSERRFTAEYTIQQWTPDLLRTTQVRQRTHNSLWNTQFSSEHLIRL